MDKLFVPTEGLLVRDPHTMQHVPAEGAIKPTIGPAGRYWRRRVLHGDGRFVDPPISTPQPAAKRSTRRSHDELRHGRKEE